MAIKTYAHVLAGIVRELIVLDGALVPGKDVFTRDFAADLIDVTSASPQPVAGWTTSDGGTTFAPPVVTPPAATVRSAPGPTLVKATTDDAWAKVKPRDQACIAGRASVPENLDMVARAATAMGTKPKAWFDLALGVTN